MAHNEAVIITPLVSETPLYKSGEYTTPTIEGLLVNVWLKYESYLQPIGFDIKTLYEQAFKKVQCKSKQTASICCSKR